MLDVVYTGCCVGADMRGRSGANKYSRELVISKQDLPC